MTSASGAFGVSAGGLIRRCEIRWRRGVLGSLMPLLIRRASTQWVPTILERQLDRSVLLVRLVDGEDHLERRPPVAQAAERLAVLLDRVHQVGGDQPVAEVGTCVLVRLGLADSGTRDRPPLGFPCGRSPRRV